MFKTCLNANTYKYLKLNTYWQWKLLLFLESIENKEKMKRTIFEKKGWNIEGLGAWSSYNKKSLPCVEKFIHLKVNLKRHESDNSFSSFSCKESTFEIIIKAAEMASRNRFSMKSIFENSSKRLKLNTFYSI